MSPKRKAEKNKQLSFLEREDVPSAGEVEEIIEEYTDYASLLYEEAISSPIPQMSTGPATIGIRYLGTPDILKIKGPITGYEYKFTAKNRVSIVAIEDYEGLLKRVRPARKCCGGKVTIPVQPYFGPV